jgi:hypothetical protein
MLNEKRNKPDTSKAVKQLKELLLKARILAAVKKKHREKHK